MTEWRLRATCRYAKDPEAWSTPDGKPGLSPANRAALAACQSVCPVRYECDQEARETPPTLRTGVILGGVVYDARGYPRERGGRRRADIDASRHAAAA